MTGHRVAFPAMWFSIVVGAGSVALGCLIAVAPGGGGRGLGPFHSFALLTSVAVVLGQLLPDALSALGWPALLVFGAAFGAPRLLEWLRGRIPGLPHGVHGHGSVAEGPCSDVGLELSYAAFLLHSVGDGVGLSIFAGPEHLGHGHYDVLSAIGVHTVPVTALVIAAFKARHGLRSALVRGGLVCAATLIGVWAPSALSPELLHWVEPWLTAVVAGLLMHVGTHGWAPAGPPTTLGRVMDLLALLLAGAVLALGGGAHHHDTVAHGASGHLPRFRDALVDALWSLSLQTAPMLLLGLLLAAVVQTYGARVPLSAPALGGRARPAWRGAILGLVWPICACRILAVATSLRRRGVAPAFVVAFLFATPGLGADTFVLSSHFLGGPLSVVRLLGVVLLALLAALLLSSQVSDQGAAPVVANAARSESEPHAGLLAAPGRPGVQLLHHFEGLFYHVGAWTGVGLLVAAYVMAALPRDAMRGLDSAFLDVLLVSVLALPSYVCASSAVPLAAVLLDKGLSAGAVLAGLWLGPAVNLASLTFLRRVYGARAAAAGLAGLLLAALALSVLVNAFYPQVSLVVSGHAPSALSYGSAALLLVLVLRAVWRSGLRTWFSSLGEVLAYELEPPTGPQRSGERLS